MTGIPPPNSAAPPVAPSSPSTPSAPAVAPSSSTGSGAVLTQLPSNLQSAGPGTVISGTVIGTDNQGQTLLQTNSGVVGFTTSASLPPGQQVSLQVQAAGSQLQAVIVSSQPPTPASVALIAAAAQALSTAAGQTAATPAATIAPTVSAGPIVLATVIGPSALVATAAAGPSPAQTTALSPAANSLRSAVAAPSASGAPVTPSSTTVVQSTTATPATPAATTPASASTGAPSAALPTNAPQSAAAAASPSATPSPLLPNTAASSAPNPAPQAQAPAATAIEPPPTGATPPPATNAPAVSTPATATPTPTAAAGNLTASAPAPASASTSASQAPPPAAAGALVATNPAATPPVVGRPVATLVASYAASSSNPSPAVPTTGGTATVATLAGAWPATPPGTQIQLRLVSALPTPSNPAAPAAVPASSNQLPATVIGQTPGGQTVVDTALGHLALTLPPNTNAANGKALAFEVISIAAGAMGEADAAGLSATVVSQRALPGLGHEWPAMKEVLDTLVELNAPLARQVIDQSTARPATLQFLRQILSFISTPTSDVRTLLGHTAAATLEQAGRGDLLTRLDGDLREMNRLNQAPTDWRVLFVPIMDAHELRQLRVFTRKKKSGQDKERDSGGRFIVEIEFEETGPLQLDGLIQKPRIDLILRSHTQLAQSMRQGIADVFDRTCATAGLAGKLFFQAAPAFPVSPLDEMTKSSSGGLSV